MTITWPAVEGAVAYDVEWRKDSGNWIKVQRTGSTNVDVVGIYAGAYVARVRAVSAFDISSIWRNSVLTELKGKEGLPPAVSFLTATPLMFGIYLKWGFPEGSSDTQRTEIWYGPTTSQEASTKLTDLAYPQSDFSLLGLAAGVTFYFWARLVDRIGNIGPWYPIGTGVQGQSSAEAGPILDLIAGQIGETELSDHLREEIEKIPGLQDQIDNIADALEYDPAETYLQGDTVRVGRRLYQAEQNVPIETPPPNPTYWVDIGQVLEEANALAAQVSKNTLDIEIHEGQITAQATKLDGVYIQVNPALAGDTEGFAGSDQVYVGVWSEQSARLEDGVATAKRVDTVEAEVNETSATVQTVSQAVATLDGQASAMWSVKMQLNANGQYVAAGIGLGIENVDGTLQSQFLVSADRFALVNTIAGGAISVPFAVQGGQVFMNSAFIQDGSITMLKIGQYLQSDNYVAGSQGWRLDKAGNLEFNGPAPGGGRLTMTNRAIKVFDQNGVKRVQLGDLSA
jgi:predicted phage tail protein